MPKSNVSGQIWPLTLVVNKNTILLIVSWEVSSLATGNCPAGWLDASLVNLGCLYFSSTTSTWLDAAKFCADQNSYMIEIHTEEQYDFILMEILVI